jgi:hypothetical protein
MLKILPMVSGFLGLLKMDFLVLLVLLRKKPGLPLEKPSMGQKYDMNALLKAYLHGQWFSVSDATAASKDRNNPIFCAVSDATAASDTENPRLCKQTISN